MSKTVAVQFRLSPALVKRLRHYCVDVERSRSAVVEEWVQWMLDDLDAKRARLLGTSAGEGAQDGGA